MIPPNPDEMSPADRLAELAEAFATAYLRLLISRRKELELSPIVEAPCEQMVDAKESVTRKELS